MGAVTTSIVVQFLDRTGGETGAHLSAEVDSREDGLNSGITQFYAGDSPAFLVYKSSDVTIGSMETTSGVIVPAGSGEISIEEIITFTKTAESNVSKPPISAPVLTLLSGSAPGLSSIGSKVFTSAPCLAVVRAVYNASFTAYRLTQVPETLGGSKEFPVIIFISGTAG